MRPLIWQDSTVLVTGGTGSFGRKFIELLLPLNPRKLVVFSRDELKQFEMQQTPIGRDPRLRYFIGDVRDQGRLERAFHGIDVVVHAAALKQVPACEYNPIEAVKTNIEGGKNVIEAALDQKVPRVLALSTDKAVNPVNLYGATKLVAEKLFVQANAYAGLDGTKFSSVRYGNVIGSRGSVVPLFQQQRASGRITITDERMTRFWLSLDQGVRFVMSCIEKMHGGEVFIPKIPSIRITDLAAAMAPGCAIDKIGIRPGEKLHELLIGEDESRSAVEFDDMYVIEPLHPWWSGTAWQDGKRTTASYSYSSETNPHFLTVEDLKKLAPEAP